MRGTTKIQWDEILQTLANERRRRVLDYVRTNGGSTSVDDIVSYLVAEEEGTSESDSTRVHLNLYHVHLPKLSDADLLSWDGGDEVTLGPLATHVAPEFVSPPSVAGTGGVGEADD